MYFTSLVRFPSSEAPRMSVRRPGTALCDGGTKLRTADSAGEVRSYLPESLPDRPSPEARPQKVEQEYRGSNDVAVDEVNHNQR